MRAESWERPRKKPVGNAKALPSLTYLRSKQSRVGEAISERDRQGDRAVEADDQGDARRQPPVPVARFQMALVERLVGVEVDEVRVDGMELRDRGEGEPLGVGSGPDTRRGRLLLAVETEVLPVDATGAWLVGAKGEYPLHRPYLLPRRSRAIASWSCLRS
jgi:hypothetical protein